MKIATRFANWKSVNANEFLHLQIRCLYAMCNACSTPATYFGYWRYTGVAVLLCVVAVKTFRLLVSPVLMQAPFCVPVTQYGCFSAVFSGSWLGENGNFQTGARRTTPGFVRRAPVGYFRIFTALHRSCSQLHVALLAARHITVSGLFRFLRLGVEHELYEAENALPIASQSVPYGNILKPKSAFAA